MPSVPKGRLLASTGKWDHRRLLIIDYHIVIERVTTAKEECNSEVVYIPGGYTSMAQPMDKSINKPFKDKI